MPSEKLKRQAENRRALRELVQEFLNNQQPLGREFEKIWDDNAGILFEPSRTNKQSSGKLGI